MKVENISNNLSHPTSVNISLTNKGGSSNIVTLKPGEFVYGEIVNNNNQLRIYSQKGIIKVEEDIDKPDNMDYYVVYASYGSESLNKELKTRVTVREEDLTKVSELHNISKEDLVEEVKEIARREGAEEVEMALESASKLLENSEEVIEMGEQLLEEIRSQNQEEIEIEVMVPEESIKNKGGRPKGSKNKSKRGRPKKKKPVGRPRKKK